MGITTVFNIFFYSANSFFLSIDTYIGQVTAAIDITCNLRTADERSIIGNVFVEDSLVCNIRTILCDGFIAFSHYVSSIILSRCARVALHDGYFVRRTNVDNRISLDFALIAATKNVADGSDVIINLTTNIAANSGNIRNIWDIAKLRRNCNCLSGLKAFYHIDVYLRVSIGL